MELTMTEILPFFTAVVGGLVTYFVTRSNNKNALTISDRQLLSQDQWKLIAELREMMVEQKGEIEQLREEIAELQATNHILTMENKELIKKIKRLSQRLEQMTGEKEEDL